MRDPRSSRESLEGRRTGQQGAELSKEAALRKVARALDEVQYGEIIIKMQAGKPVWVDKYERERVGS
ncbi:MAG: DUF2292 domain-containing protein [bacterium]|nr:DUF2292 domain-containing protein [bacterium]